jgi:hypothetical protein
MQKQHSGMSMLSSNAFLKGQPADPTQFGTWFNSYRGQTRAVVEIYFNTIWNANGPQSWTTTKCILLNSCQFRVRLESKRLQHFAFPERESLNYHTFTACNQISDVAKVSNQGHSIQHDEWVINDKKMWVCLINKILSIPEPQKAPPSIIDRNAGRKMDLSDGHVLKSVMINWSQFGSSSNVSDQSWARS